MKIQKNKKIKTTRLKSCTPLFVSSIIFGIMHGGFATLLFAFNFDRLNRALLPFLFFFIIGIFWIVVFIFQLISIIRKKYIIKHGRIKTGVVLYRNYHQYSKFIVEFKNGYGKKVRTIFKTKGYIYYSEAPDTPLINYGIEDEIPLFVYGNYGYYDYYAFAKIDEEKEIAEKRAERLAREEREKQEETSQDEFYGVHGFTKAKNNPYTETVNERKKEKVNKREKSTFKEQKVEKEKPSKEEVYEAYPVTDEAENTITESINGNMKIVRQTTTYKNGVTTTTRTVTYKSKK